MADFPNYERRSQPRALPQSPLPAYPARVPAEAVKLSTDSATPVLTEGARSPASWKARWCAAALTCGRIVGGNLLGFVRVAFTAYLLGTHSQADSLAVAIGPIDTLNSVLINSVVFAFVPMLTACAGSERPRCSSSCAAGLLWLFSLSALAGAGRALADADSGAGPRPGLFRHGGR